MKASINAFKGFNFQATIYCYLLCLMDLNREIIEIDAEKNVDDNFDDVFVKTKESEYYFQIKNYQDTKFEHIKIKKDRIEISGHKDILIGDTTSKKTNIVILKNVVIPEDKLTVNIFGFKCFKTDNCLIAGYNEFELNDIIDKSFSDLERCIEILRFADGIINSGNFKVTQDNLPIIHLYKQKLQEETLKVREFIIDDFENILFIVGNPGVGKSHLVNELEQNDNCINMIIERLWISEDDVDKKERIKYSNFISDLSKRIFLKSAISSEEDIISELKNRNQVLVIDGLDHVENYNSDDLEKYFEFISKFNDSKLIVLTRPLQHDIEYNVIKLENWTEKETINYLQIKEIGNYSDWLKIYNISKGYPIIVSFLSEHLRINNEIPDLNKMESLNEFYDSLIKDGIAGMSLFLVNDSYYKKDELDNFLNPTENAVLQEIIKKNPYLFSIKYDRICLIHDSLNQYLRINNPDYINLRKDIIKKVYDELVNDNYRFLSRFDCFLLEDEMKVDVVKKYCSFDSMNTFLKNTIDYELFPIIICEFGNVILNNFDQFSINEIYEYVLLSECCNRNHHDGFYKLIIERIKYYIQNNLISMSKLYSKELLMSAYISITEKDLTSIAQNYSSRFNDTDREVENFYTELVDSLEYFKIYKERIDIQEYINDNITNNEYKNEQNLIYIISYLYINKINYNNLEKIAISIIDKKNESEAEIMLNRIFYQYNISPRYNLARHMITRIKDYLFSLGIDNGDNYYKNLTLHDLINDVASHGSFYVSDYVSNYIRLATYEKRTIDIDSVYEFYYMYYNRKDYSTIKLPIALYRFYQKGYIAMKECVDIIYNTMEMSEKGIRTIMTDFFKYMSDKDYLNSLELWNDRIYIEDLPIERINITPDEIIMNYIYSHIMYYHRYYKDIKSDEYFNLFKCNIVSKIIEAFDKGGYTIDGISVNDFDYESLEKDTEKNKPFEDRDYITENDGDKILEADISCTDLAKYTDGWHNTLPYVNLFNIYNKEEINNNINEILYNALFSYKIFDMYANRNELPGNYIDLLFSYSIEVDWDELYKSFIHFLSFSLIKK